MVTKDSMLARLYYCVLFLAVPWVCLQFVIVVFSYHTPLLFITSLGYELSNIDTKSFTCICLIISSNVISVWPGNATASRI